MRNKSKIFLLLLIVLILGLSLYLLQGSSSETGSTHDIYQYSTLDTNNLSFDIAKITSEGLESLTFYYKSKDGQEFTTIADLKEQEGELMFATNGGIFSKAYEPLGLYIKNGTTISQINTDSGEGNFYLQPNGIFLLGQGGANIVKTKKYRADSGITFAIQSGPLLVLENEINSSFSTSSQNRYIRSGVGVDQKGNVIFAISNQPVTFYEFASLFRDELQCSNALYLDGAISEMYVPKYRENTEEKFSVIIGIVEK